jgi:hypothetical protein
VVLLLLHVQEKSGDVYHLSGLEKLTTAGLSTLELKGSGTENGMKVEVRISMTIGRNYYRYVKETRLPVAEFEFRDGFQFTRRDPPPLMR